MPILEGMKPGNREIKWGESFALYIEKGGLAVDENGFRGLVMSSYELTLGL